MLLKNLIITFFYLFTNYVYICSYIYTVISIIFLLNAQLRVKFTLFVVNLYFIFIFGTFLYLDGYFFILIITEFTLILLFLVVYTQLYSSLTQPRNYPYFYKFSFIFFILYNNSAELTFLYFSYFDYIYLLRSIDFFIFFYFFFIKFYLLTILVILIISFFSIYFILLYFFLKTLNIDFFKSIKTLKILRKQNISKQAIFTSKLRFFQAI
jgi:hypothetical protein